MTIERRIDNKPLQILQHIGFWLLSFVVFLWAITKETAVQEVDVLYTLQFHVLLMPAVYINLNNFLYKLRVPKAWFKYTLKLMLLLVAFTFVNYQYFQHWSIHVFPDYYFISYFPWWEVAIIYFTYITITTLIKGTRSWFLLWKVRAELQAAEKQKVQLELQTLKAQINPHFLFNTLNGIYSMSLDNDKRLPETILTLSGLMRYFLYEAKDDFVPLKKELQLLENYLLLQELRLGSDIEMYKEIKGNAGEYMIAPMLLITFLENAFKHGNKTATGQPFLKLAIDIKEGILHFTLENDKGKVDEVESKDNGGVGLPNIKRRLQLLYPLRHELVITDNTNNFKVQLKLTLS